MSRQYYESSRGLIAYDKRGWGDPLVLLHDVYPGASHHEFDRNITALARHFTVYAIDWLGFGDSDKPRLTYTSQLYQHLVRDFVVEEIGASVSIIASGISCGPAVSLAVYNDSLVRRLMLVAPSTESTPLDYSPSIASRIQQFLLGTLSMGVGLYETVSSKYEIRQFLQTRYAKPRRVSAQMVEEISERATQRHAVHAVLSQMTGNLALDVPRWLRSVRCEVLIVLGDKLDTAHSDQLTLPAAWSRGKRIEVMADAAYWPHDEQSAKFNELAIAFLCEQPDQKGTA